MQERHFIQIDILKKLLFSQGLKFTELKPSEDLENSHFNFHLNQLISENFVEKTKDLYSLTQKGKEYANRMTTEDTKMNVQAKVSILNICFRGAGDDQEILFYTRLKHPFYGMQGFPSGKVKFGDTIVDTAKRELYEETQLTGEPELFAVRHFRVFDKNTKEFLEDKIFFNFKFANPKGKLVGCEEGKYEWVKLNQAREFLKRPISPIESIMDLIYLAKNANGKIAFEEIEHHTEDF